jgi:hypothetical protein
VAAVVALLTGFLVAQFTPASIMASLLSLFTAAIVYPLMLKLIYRKSASIKAGESVPELLTEANLSETPAQQP